MSKAGQVGELDVSAQEVHELWSLLDGAIMSTDIRRHLWKNWGLCPRHSWSYAVVEIEVRGGKPFSTTILYEDLIGRAVQKIKSASRLPWSVAHRRLESRAFCFTCDYLSIAKGQANEIALEMAQRVNLRRRLLPLLRESQAQWTRASCPLCLGGSGPICRQHLLTGIDPGSRDDLAGKLAELHQRLSMFKNSMTWQGPEASASDRSSWVEALGWFSGWQFPRAILGGGQQTLRAS